MNIIEQLIDNIPEGEYQLKKPVIRIPEGSYYAAVEGAAASSGSSSRAGATSSPTHEVPFDGPARLVPGNHRPGTKIADPIAIGGTGVVGLQVAGCGSGY